MQQKPDYLDNIIRESSKDVSISQNYNNNLLNKLKQSGSKEHKKYNFLYRNRAAALSFIFSGIIMALVATTNMESKIINLEGKFRSEALIFQYQYNYKFDSVKSLLGEWF
ncbi:MULTISPECIES: hypothetical protein [Clostridium]|jgi:hypothetical protein|uniref:hypothetical protein n=1 Tax=Clostridium TaxID=1485 RepID=UPI000287AEED|nr:MULTISPECIES: hypothetical protein [Clostridium]MDF2502992.1 hypothetical protein [Clostridium sp.]